MCAQCHPKQVLPVTEYARDELARHFVVSYVASCASISALQTSDGRQQRVRHEGRIYSPTSLQKHLEYWGERVDVRANPDDQRVVMIYDRKTGACLSRASGHRAPRKRICFRFRTRAIGTIVVHARKRGAPRIDFKDGRLKVS
jgi:hypothetical protein